MKDWKSTVQGVLSMFLAVGAVLLTQPNVLPTKVTVGLTLATGIAKAILGVIEKDAPTTPQQETRA